MLARLRASLLSRRIPLKEGARYLVIWAGVAGVLLLGAVYKNDVAEAFVRVRAALIPGYAAPGAPHELVIGQDAGGGFLVEIFVPLGATVEPVGTAPPAWAEAARLRFSGCVEEPYVFAPGPPRGAGRQAVDPGGQDSCEKFAVERGVAQQELAVEPVVRSLGRSAGHQS